MLKKYENEEDQNKLDEIMKKCLGPFDGPGGPFREGLKIAIQGWDRSSAFVVLELGCGTGMASAKCIKFLKQQVRTIKNDAVIKVYQMDLSMTNSSDVASYAEKWKDENCLSFFLPQSFYDPFKMNEKAHMMFSMASIHWVPLDQKWSPWSVDYLLGEEARKTSKSLLKVLMRNIASRLQRGGSVVITCIGINCTDTCLPLMEWGSKLYSAGFKAAFPEDEVKFNFMNCTPQVPHRLEDIMVELKSLPNFKWVKGGKVGKKVPTAEFTPMTPEFAKTVAHSMMAGLPIFKDRFIAQWPSKAKDWDTISTVAAETMAAHLINSKGLFTGAGSTIYFIARTTSNYNIQKKKKYWSRNKVIMLIITILFFLKIFKNPFFNSLKAFWLNKKK